MGQLTSEKTKTTKSTITMSPLIDLNPSDENCIYSTLLYITDQAKYLNIETPCVNFDSPLWIKVSEIVKAKNSRIFLHFGRFRSVLLGASVFL